ncbi:N-terminal C2 in EEIG1 and EHBP1 proteins [Rhizoctonia solani]|uniref:N-terminal C2 in EEIG1 and EHBP1 proteins n=1 Tax=Rhizoctonia solani TaxID=456999 RepID=A0A8H8P5J0_9AGAM|nr:N-terminal C2 in EEIG1 and EHBP1 proteins [Rhizoctonia solani]QRW25909.1 N-terminal C2 in EEIG1 and EHBP1 proteins [Rhizoctonia solani]
MNPTTGRGSVSTTVSLNDGWSSPSESSDSRHTSLLHPDGSGSIDQGSDTEDAQRSVAASTNSSTVHMPGMGPGRGRTPTVAIADHTVRWDELVEMAVPMGIVKETKGLMPADLKLTVEQVPQSPEHLVKPRAALGVVRINLAEYAGKGPVTRRYLLRESKTNATLKLTIQVKWLSGEQGYVAPPLQKAQIMEGVAGLMSHDRILPSGMRTPTRAAASPTQSSISLAPHNTPDLLSAPGLIRGRAPSLSRTPTLSHSLSHSRSTSPLPSERTEQIIEALFNPVPTTNPNPSPFAYYAPARPPVRRGTANPSPGTSELGSGWSMIKARKRLRRGPYCRAARVRVRREGGMMSNSPTDDREHPIHSDPDYHPKQSESQRTHYQVAPKSHLHNRRNTPFLLDQHPQPHPFLAQPKTVDTQEVPVQSSVFINRPQRSGRHAQLDMVPSVSENRRLSERWVSMFSVSFSSSEGRCFRTAS